ncbi:hypothetical protein [Sedimentimonas flavescens]|uniref:hypothetical protein n=1 Tax=Sedimentimonas flavescens TaxID=2851012 RepID=UPI001C4A581C|nr:hypothetical protein [Sedimentimonas flavescens]MBW0159589.1 hypothetical protein [Sedimentimonas flavescens]
MYSSEYCYQKSLEFGNVPKLKPIKFQDATDKVAAAIKAAAPHADRAIEWGRKQQAWANAHLPNGDQIEIWLKENAERYGWDGKPASTSLEHLEDTLTQIVSSIRQTSDRRTRIFVKAVIGKLGGAMAVGGIAGLVSTFGAASTGTAIAALSGAAATTAQLYWIGSLVGLGVAGGGLMLAAGGIGVGVAAGMWGRNKLLGQVRSEGDLQDHEKAILVASITLINAVAQQRELGRLPTSAEMRLVAEQALIPLANQINQYWDDASLNENGKSECQPFTRTLAYLQRRKLDRCRTELGRIALAAMAPGPAT